jgi:Immunoglobulin-like domain of bacterial spore germination
MRYLMLTALVGLVTLGVACSSGDNSSTQTTTGTHTASASATAPPTSAPTVTPTATVANTATPSPIANVCQTNPSPATSAQTVVNQPQPGDLVTSPVTVSGQINAFEAQFNIAIKDASGADIATQPGHSQQGQTLSPFNESVAFTVATQTLACLWVFDLSAKDGSLIQVVQVPITLAP